MIAQKINISTYITSSYITTYFILARWTNVDHENLTNEEVEWKEMLKRKKKVSYKTALGNKIEWANR